MESLDGGIPVDLLVGVRRGDGAVEALPFVEDAGTYPGWKFAAAEDVKRTMTACVDEFAWTGAGVTLKAYTPQAALPNPKRSGNLQYATAPGVLLEVSVDNTAGTAEATVFVGLRQAAGLRGVGCIRPLDWSSKTLVGVASSGRWALAAAGKGEATTLQAEDLSDWTPRIDPKANAGGVLVKVPAGTSKTVSLVFAVFEQGLVTQGIDARFFYMNYFPRVEAVANFLLANAQRVRESCVNFDGRVSGACGDARKLAVFASGVRAYNALTQVVDSATPTGPAAYFAALAPDGPRNGLDRIIDHLPWELFRNPWVIRNVFDLATTAYAYRDRVKFPGDATPEESRDGGMTFARDFGFASTYAPGAMPATSAGPGGRPVSAFDGAGSNPGWSGGEMASEVLLNSLYMLTSYALMADDTPWAKTRLPFARELLVSLENRDHWDPAQRTGILKAESSGSKGPEQTVFGGRTGVDGALGNARGNLYLAVKTFCANLLLTTYFQNNNDLHSADYSYAFAQKTAAAIAGAFKGEYLPANLLTGEGADVRMLAALEPLALPTYLGLTSTLAEYFPELFKALQGHAAACLKAAPEGCLDGTTLRLASNSPATCPAKVISILFVLERLFQIEVPAGVWDNLATQAASMNDPQIISAALYARPVAVVPTGA
jgi:hypothetical protein